MKHTSGGLLLAAFCLTIPASLAAQADIYAPTVLQIAPTPRAATFGSVTAVRDIEAIFNNPALVGVAPGTIVAARQERFLVATGEGLLALGEVQAEGKRPMDVRDFLAGHRVVPGDRFTEGS